MIVLALASAALGGGVASAQSWLARTPLAELRRELQSGDLADRERAAMRLGREGSESGARRVLLDAYFVERASRVRIAIAHALAWRAHPSIVDELVSAFDASNGPESQNLAMALAAAGAPQAKLALVDALVREDLRPAARAGILRVGVELAPMLLGRLRDDPSNTVLIELLGELRHAGAVPALARLATSDAAPVRRAALTALRTIGDPRANALVATTVDDPDPTVARVAQDALLALALPRDAERVETWLDEASEGRRRTLLTALLHLEPERGAARLAEQAASEDPARVLLAGDIALEHPQPALLPLLYGLYEEGARRAEAASALAEVEGGAGVAILVRELEEAEGAELDEGRRALAVALRRWREELAGRMRERALRILRAGPVEGPARWRTLTLRALAGDEDVQAPLEDGLGSEDTLARTWAAQALGLLGRGREALAAALVDEEDHDAFRAMAFALSDQAVSADVGLVAAARASVRVPARAVEALLLYAALPLRGRLARERGRILRQALRDPRDRVRASAAFALARAEEDTPERSVGPWRALLDRVEVDDSLVVRRAAARALAVVRSGRRGRGLVQTRVDQRARTEPDDEVRGWLERAVRGVHTPVRTRGDEVLRFRVVASGAPSGVLVDARLDDGRWLRLRTLATGELFLADLPAQTVESRVVVE